MFYVILMSFFAFHQNQPALEKDRYKIRQAFVAAPGNSLIVADYGQVGLLSSNSSLSFILLKFLSRAIGLILLPLS